MLLLKTRGRARQNAATFCDTKSPTLDERALQSDRNNIFKASCDRRPRRASERGVDGNPQKLHDLS